MIHAADLSMRYGSRVALEGASFDVEPGQVVGLLGPNGAGKSTTMKILTTYLSPSRGGATVGGKSVRDEPLAVRRLIGYLPEVLPLYPEMRAGAYLSFVGRARGLRGARLRQRRAWVEERCGLEGMSRHLIRELSKGYQQRLGLAQALIHDPQVVILDEPTSSLDPHQILAVRQLVWDLAGDGKTVLLSTHILQEVEAIADRLVVINQGTHRRQRHAGQLAARPAAARTDVAVGGGAAAGGRVGAERPARPAGASVSCMPATTTPCSTCAPPPARVCPGNSAT